MGPCVFCALECLYLENGTGTVWMNKSACFLLYRFFTETGRFGLRSFPGHFDLDSLDLYFQ